MDVEPTFPITLAKACGRIGRFTKPLWIRDHKPRFGSGRAIVRRRGLLPPGSL